MKTLRIGCALPLNIKILLNAILFSGLIFLIPSTPAVFFPLLSCVILRTANNLASDKLMSFF